MMLWLRHNDVCLRQMMLHLRCNGRGHGRGKYVWNLPQRSGAHQTSSLPARSAPSFRAARETSLRRRRNIIARSAPSFRAARETSLRRRRNIIARSATSFRASRETSLRRRRNIIARSATSFRASRETSFAAGKHHYSHHPSPYPIVGAAVRNSVNIRARVTAEMAAAAAR